MTPEWLGFCAHGNRRRDEREKSPMLQRISAKWLEKKECYTILLFDVNEERSSDLAKSVSSAAWLSRAELRKVAGSCRGEILRNTLGRYHEVSTATALVTWLLAPTATRQDRGAVPVPRGAQQ